MITARILNDEISAAFSRRGETLRSLICATVITLSIGTVGATLVRFLFGAGEAGTVGAIPAMANAVMMFDALGYPRDHPNLVIARKAIDKLLVVTRDEAYCQPCVSPVWDTALVCHTLLDAGGDAAVKQAVRGLEWLAPLQVVVLPWLGRNLLVGIIPLGLGCLTWVIMRAWLNYYGNAKT